MSTSMQFGKALKLFIKKPGIHDCAIHWVQGYAKGFGHKNVEMVENQGTLLQVFPLHGREIQATDSLIPVPSSWAR